jgi:RNA polymerase sigma-70 factor (ECF subfamily)
MSTPHEASFSCERFEDVVRRHRRSVTLSAFHFTQNAEDASDIAQHVFFQMFRKRVCFSDQRSIQNWLYVATRNEALNLQRRRERDVGAKHRTADDGPPPGLEDTVIQNERRRNVRAFIARLPGTDRKIIEMRYLRAFSTTEMAEELGLPVKRVKRDVERAKCRLRNEIRRTGSESDFT